VNPIITAALNGPIATRANNPALPESPADIASSAKSAYEAGAAVIHIHLRDDQGKFTTDLDVAKRTVEAVREVCPGVVQLSTGGMFPYGNRMRIVEAKPAMATLNPCTMSFADAEFRNPPKQMRQLAARMIELGVKPEVELYDVGHLGVMLDLVKEGLLLEPLQVSFVMGVKGGMPGDPKILSWLVSELPEGASWQVIAIARANLMMTTIGLAMGGNARTGMEDTLMMERGVLADSNAQLVQRLVGVARSLNREPAGVDDVIKRLELSPGLIGNG
jgi:3-keto-5-aminohexanoate cleavage enzyme